MYVEFARELDTRDWARRHAAGVAPDATPYGLHHLSDACARVRFRPATTHPTAARRARRLLGGSDVVPTLGGLRDRERANADVVLCMDERPASPRPCGRASRRWSREWPGWRTPARSRPHTVGSPGWRWLG